MGLNRVELSVPVSAEAEAQIQSWMPPCYYRDDYPREGCTLVISVGKERCQMVVHAPNGKMLETYSLTSVMLGEYVEAWRRGQVPGRKSADTIVVQ